MTEQRRRTKILATLGPATDAPGVLDALLRAGVDVVRLNFSHGDPSGQIARAEAVRAAAARVGREVGILADLPGPKIRIEKFANDKVKLRAGERFDLLASADAPPGDETQVGVSYLGLPNDVVPGDVRAAAELKKLGYEPIGSSSAELVAAQRADLARWEKSIKSTGVQLD